MFVYAQHRPIKANPYADKPPIIAISDTPGITPVGPLANAAIPADNDSIPAPTILLTKLKISCVTVASPSLSDAAASVEAASEEDPSSSELPGIATASDVIYKT